MKLVNLCLVLLRPSNKVGGGAHACAKFTLNGKRYALNAFGHSHETEFLDLDDVQNGWKLMTKTMDENLPKYSAQIVVLNQEEVFLVGGYISNENRSESSKLIFKLECDSGEVEMCAWKKINQSLKVARSGHLAFAVPDSLAQSICN